MKIYPINNVLQSIIIKDVNSIHKVVKVMEEIPTPKGTEK